MLLRMMQGCKRTIIYITTMFCVVHCTIPMCDKNIKYTVYLMLLTSFNHTNVPIQFVNLRTVHLIENALQKRQTGKQ